MTIFQNVPPGAFFTTIKLAVSLNLIFMYPVTMLPASKALETALSVESRPASCGEKARDTAISSFNSVMCSRFLRTHRRPRVFCSPPDRDHRLDDHCRCAPPVFGPGTLKRPVAILP